MDITVKELGIFKDKDFYSEVYTPCKYDMSEEKLWLANIQHVETKLVRDNNRKASTLENYNLWFRINDGSNRKNAYATKISLVLNITIKAECFPKEEPEDTIIKGLKDALSKYPIIFIEEVLAAFAQRKYYRYVERLVLKKR